MAARVVSVAFEGVEARRVEVEVQVVGGLPAFVVVGLADKAVGEARERVRAAFAGLGLALPHERVVANLAPADLPKEGNHFDLPIALALMAAMGIIPQDALDGWAAIGELNLNGGIAPVAGALPAAIAAGAMGLGLICPEACGPEAAWAGETADPRAALADRPRQPLPRQPGAGPAQARADARRRAPARFEGRQGSGERQAGAGDRRRRRPQPSLHRPAGRREIDARAAPAGHPAAAHRGRAAGDLHGPQHRRPDRQGRPDPRPTVPQPPPFGEHGGAHRRRPQGQAGRGVAGPQWRALPR